ncbi:hypothetical protein KQI63_16315 [bacterium]|nr:hypothetical protein [bacterium]
MFADRETSSRYYDFLATLQFEHIKTIKAMNPESRAFSFPLSTGYALADGAGTYITEISGWGLGDDPVSDEEINSTLARYEEVGFTPHIELSVHADKTLMPRLEDRGFRLEEWIVASGRPARKEDLTPTLPAGIVFRQPRDEECEEWARVLALGHFSKDEGEIDENTMDIGRAAFHCPWGVPFVAEIDGEMAGAAVVAIQHGIGYMMTASTLPKFRRRGVQSGLVLVRNAEAVRQGATELLHQSSINTSSNRNAMATGMEIRMVSAYMTLP